MLGQRNGQWQPVSGATAYGCEMDRFNRVTFDPIEVKALRLEVQLQPEWSAGVLEDAALLRQDMGKFARVFRPKVEGAWNLHRFTQGMGLDLFVLFSSIAAVFGSAGQCNYGAANAVLDALAQMRRWHGLAGTSIQWGMQGVA